MTKNEKNGARAYIYTRVSTVMQVDGFSLEAQKRRIEEYATYQHMKVVGMYSDEVHQVKILKVALSSNRC